VTFLIDTSLWISLLKDRSGACERQLDEIIGQADTVISSAIQMEILRGARNETEWQALEAVMTREVILPISHEDWGNAARIYFDLRRKGLTVRSMMDCLIAQSALEQDLTLLHNDRDFEVIAQIRALKHQRVDYPDSQDNK